MDCEYEVYSEEFQDYLIEYYGDGSSITSTYEVDCYQRMSNRFAVVYKESPAVDTVRNDGRLTVPRCFGLLSSTETLEVAGVTPVQRRESLGLYGQGVLVGIIDTGAGV